VGRELAIRWCVTGGARLARAGAFALWLVRASDGDAAPESDARRLAAELARAVGSADAAAIARLCDCLEVAFDELRSPRDRSQVSGAIVAAGAAEAAADLAGSADAGTRDAAVRVLALARDARYTAALLTVAAEPSPAGDAAAAAINGIWGEPGEPPEMSRELLESLRFSRGALAALVASGPARVKEQAARRLRELIAPPAPPPPA